MINKLISHSVVVASGTLCGLTESGQSGAPHRPRCMSAQRGTVLSQNAGSPALFYHAMYQKDNQLALLGTVYFDGW